MDDFRNPAMKPWASAAATSSLATGLPAAGHLGGTRSGSVRVAVGALIPNPPVTGVLPARRQVLTS